MTLAELETLANAELRRLGVDHCHHANPEGLVCLAEPGRKPLALRMESGWFTAVYSAEGLLDLLRCLRLNPGRDREVYWASGAFWTQIKERNLEMIDHNRRMAS